MIADKIIELPEGERIEFGRPDSGEETRQMYTLRREVYVEEKGYIPEAEGGGLDIDEHDKKGHCLYFIAKIRDKVVGTARIITEEELPTEKEYFAFKEPSAIGKIPRTQIFEIGRIISRAQKKTRLNIPRGLIIMGLFFTMTEYAKTHKLQEGYGSIKLYALRRFLKNWMPIHRIKNFRLTYNPEDSTDPLSNFFSKEDPVVPVYYLTDEVYRYMQRVFNNGVLFQRVADEVYIVKKTRLNALDKLKLFYSV